MTGWQQHLRLASAAYRRSAFHLDRAGDHVEALRAAIPPDDADADDARRLAAAATEAARRLTPGALGADLTGGPVDGGSRITAPETIHVRLGTARLAGTGFPAVVPLLGAGHLVVDADVAHPVVDGLIGSVLVRLAASVDRLELSLVDCVTLGQTFDAVTPLVNASVIDPVATDAAGLERVLDAAEARVHEAHRARATGAGLGELPYRLIVVAGLPPHPQRSLLARIAALAHAGPHARTHLILAGWRGSKDHDWPAVEHGRYLAVDPSGGRGGHRVRGIPAPIDLDPAPSPTVASRVYRALCERRDRESRLDLGSLLPETEWSASSVPGLSTVVGRDDRGPVELSFDDATPHWLIAGRTGGGKTVFLLGTLYGLAARYGPDEMTLYLLDFKEGVSFTEFTPSDHDPSWMPQVRAVGVESDREYGVAVLAALRAEMGRRADAMKRAGVTKLADLRRRTPETRMPRIVLVVDEFHVLFAGNDRLAREAVAHLEELARKGRAYGVHLALASQSVSGVEALYAKQDSIFGQFPLRVALPGARQVLHTTNTAADGITLGQAVVNTEGGAAGFNRIVHFPDATADPEALRELRHRWWSRRDPAEPEPIVFAGYARQHVADDPDAVRRADGTDRPRVVIGRSVDLEMTTAAFEMAPVPGRHVALVGSSEVAADIQHAAVTGLAGQHRPGEARFIIANLTVTAGAAIADAAAVLAASHHDHKIVTAADLPEVVTSLAEDDTADVPTYVVIAGSEAVASTLTPAQLKQYRWIIKHGPARGIHLIGWWRNLRALTDDLGGSGNREDIACLVMVNVAGPEFGAFIGDAANDYAPRDNRVLAIDRHRSTTTLCVPYARPA